MRKSRNPHRARFKIYPTRPPQQNPHISAPFSYFIPSRTVSLSEFFRPAPLLRSTSLLPFRIFPLLNVRSPNFRPQSFLRSTNLLRLRVNLPPPSLLQELLCTIPRIKPPDLRLKTPPFISINIENIFRLSSKCMPFPHFARFFSGKQRKMNG